MLALQVNIRHYLSPIGRWALQENEDMTLGTAPGSIDAYCAVWSHPVLTSRATPNPTIFEVLSFNPIYSPPLPKSGTSGS